MRIDLHLHSTASDGTLSPEDLVGRARAAGLDLIALADHDTVAGVEPAREASGDHPTVVPAIEISATHRGRDLHVLGYFIDPASDAVTEYADAAERARSERMREMIRRLREHDVPVEYDAVLDEAGADAGTLARPHLARVLWAGGHVDSVSEAFDRFIGDEGPAYVPLELVDVAGAIHRIHRAGGIAVWAHPPLPLLGGALREFVDAGLDGMEVFRPRAAPPDVHRLLNKARQHDLIVTGGSDWHGDWHGELGSFHVAPDQVARFLERGGL